MLVTRLLNGRSLAALFAAGILAIIYGCGAAGPTASSAGTGVRRDSMRALEFYLEGAMLDLREKYDDAIEQYVEALRYDNAPPINYAIAKDYYELHKPARAAQYADAAVAGDSLNTTYRLLRARIAMNMQMDFAEAQRQFEAIVAVDSNDTQALSDLGTLYQFRGQPRRAVALFRRLMGIVGPDGDVGLRLAELHVDLAEYDQAIAVLKECLRADPDDAALSEALAAAYIRTNQRDSAVAVYADIVGRFPDDVTVRRSLAILYSERGDWPSAFAQYRAICEDSTVERDTLNLVMDSLYSHLHSDSTVVDSIFDVLADVADGDSTNWYAPALCAGACLFARDDSSAREWMDEAMARTHDTTATVVTAAQIYFEHQRLSDVLRATESPDRYKDFRIYMIRAFALIRLQRRSDAQPLLYRSLEINPRNWLALGELAVCLEEEKRYASADSAYEAAIRMKPDYATALNNYSYSLAERGEQLERARGMSRQALDQEPDNVNFLDTYGWIFYRLEQLDSAVVYLQRAVAARNASPAVLEHLGDAQYRRGEHDEALRIYNRALELDEHNEALRKKIQERSIAR